MMKFYIVFVAIAIGSSCFSQNPITKNVGDFSEVKVYDRVVVNLAKATEDKVVISGMDASQVTVVNKDGVLKIRMDIEKIFDGNKTFVTVFYKDIKVIDGNEGAVITSNELIEQDHLEIRSQEGARITAGVQLKTADIRAVTGGQVEMRGLVNSQTVSVNTGGIYDGQALESQTAKVLVQAGGEVTLFTSEMIDIKIRAGGDVVVYGNPKQVIRSKTLGGRIKIM